MRINRLTLDKLQPGYVDIDLSFANVVLFVGPNNSGKTRLLDLLRSAVNSFFGIRGVGDNEHNLRVSLGIDSSPSNLLFVSLHESEIWDSPHAQAPNSGKPIGQKCANRNGPTRYKFLRAGRTTTPHLDTRQIDEILPLADQVDDLRDVLADLAWNRRLRVRLLHEVSQLIGFPDSIDEIGYQVQWQLRRHAGDRGLGMQDHGRGMQDFVSLFYYLLNPTFKLLFIDEPENSLHPQLQRMLIQRIRDVANETGKQVLISTHSPMMVFPSSTQDLKGVFIMRGDDTPPRLVDLGAVVPQDGVERRAFESYLPNVDAAIAELLFARAVLLVEGPTERQFLRAAARRCGIDPAAVGISIIDTAGLRLMPHLCRIVKHIVPNWRAMVDSDILTSKDKHMSESRKNFENILGVPSAAWLGSVDEARASLKPHRLDVMGAGLEDGYVSSDWNAYKVANPKGVEARDKGWLLERELQHLSSMTPADVQATYGVIMAPYRDFLDGVNRVVPDSDMAERMADVLFDEGIIVARAVRDLGIDIASPSVSTKSGLAKILDGYVVRRASGPDYDLVPREDVSFLTELRGQRVTVLRVTPDGTRSLRTADLAPAAAFGPPTAESVQPE